MPAFFMGVSPRRRAAVVAARRAWHAFNSVLPTGYAQGNFPSPAPARPPR